MIKQAIVLAAGKATRLGPLSQKMPKALVPILGKPVIQYMLDALVAYGVDRILVNTHHHADQLEPFLQCYPQVTIVHEEALLETGGTVLNNLDFFKGESFFVLNGDVLWHSPQENPLQALEVAWDAEKMDALLGVVPRKRAIGHEAGGDFFMDAQGRLYNISDPEAPYINTAIKIFHPRLFEGETLRIFSNRDMYIKAMEKGRLYGKVLALTWFHFGTPQSVQEGEMTFQRCCDAEKKHI